LLFCPFAPSYVVSFVLFKALLAAVISLLAIAREAKLGKFSALIASAFIGRNHCILFMVHALYYEIVTLLVVVLSNLACDVLHMFA